MTAGNPNWWSMNGMHPQLSSQFVYTSTSPNLSPADHLHNHEFPVRSWSQLLLGGLGGGEEEERYGASLFQQQKKLENWEDQVLNLNPPFARVPVADMKQEISQSSNRQIYSRADDEFQANSTPASWPPVIPATSPTSCITSLSNNILNFSGKRSPAPAMELKNHQHNQDHSSECNSTVTGGVSKKARVQTSAQPALKVRKEKLGDRITALHQLVSPFGKTDTASVLSEAIGYIRFLQGQIEALSSLTCAMDPAAAQQDITSILFKKGIVCFPTTILRYYASLYWIHHFIKRRFNLDSQGRSGVKDLRSRGLCLVPISCTQHVGNDGGADYWAPAAFGGDF